MSLKTSAVVAFVLLGAGVGAEDKPEKPHRLPTPLRVQIVFSRFQGEKRVSSAPYTLAIAADDRPTRLRMGIQVPVRQEGKDGTPSVSYKSLGNNADCNAESLDDGRFKLWCSLEQSSLYAADGEHAAPGLTNVPPVFRNFSNDATLVLRDGQSIPFTAATDPVSGEVLKIDITLNVVK